MALPALTGDPIPDGSAILVPTSMGLVRISHGYSAPSVLVTAQFMSDLLDGAPVSDLVQIVPSGSSGPQGSGAGLETSVLAGLSASAQWIVLARDPSAAGYSTINAGQALAAAGLTAPVFAGRVFGYSQRWGGINIVGLDADGNLQGIWNGDGGANWGVANLSASTGSGPLTGSLSVYTAYWDATNIFTTGQAGDLLAIWWTPDLGPGNWQIINFTRDFGGPALRPTSLVGWATRWASLNIGGIDADGSLVVYWWNPMTMTTDNPAGWIISTLRTGTFADSSPVWAAVPSSIGQERMDIYGADRLTGDLKLVYWKSQDPGSWREAPA